MSIHLARDGSALGIFSESEVREGLAASRFFLTDLGWREGMPAWTPLSAWPEFASFGMAPDSAPPATGQAMPAWERGASLANFFATIRDVAIDPVRTFDALPREGIAKPLVFNYLGMLPGLVCGVAAYALLFSIMGMATLLGPEFGNGFNGAEAPGVAFMVVFGCCFAAVLPLFGFVSAGITHLLLLPWGPKGGLAMTYRAAAYAQGAFLPFSFIPCLNYVAVIWASVANIIGQSRVHRIAWWKALISIVVLPCLLACCIAMLIVMAGGMAGMRHAGA